MPDDDPTPQQRAKHALRSQVLQGRAEGLLKNTTAWPNCSTIVVIIDHDPDAPNVHVGMSPDLKAAEAEIERMVRGAASDPGRPVREDKTGARPIPARWIAMQATTALADLLKSDRV